MLLGDSKEGRTYCKKNKKVLVTKNWDSSEFREKYRFSNITEMILGLTFNIHYIERICILKVL